MAPQDRTKEDDLDLGWDDEQEIDSGWGSDNEVEAAPVAQGAEPVGSADSRALSSASEARPRAPQLRGQKESKERQRAKSAEKSRRQKERAAAAAAKQKKPKQREAAVRTRAKVESDREAGGRERRSPSFTRSDPRSEPTRSKGAHRDGARRARVALVGVLVILAIASAIGIFVARR